MAAEITGSELLDEEALNKLNKSDLVKYALKVSNLTDLINSLSSKIDSLNDRITKTESEVAICKNANALLKEHIDFVESRMKRLERLEYQNGQYLRNRQVEIKKFPADVDDATLKEKVCEVLSLTGSVIVPDDIDKCHRMSNNANVIIEFKQREKRDHMLRNRKNLKLKTQELTDLECLEIMILESLSPIYATLDFVCRRLKKDQHLSDTWFFNGKLWVLEIGNPTKVNISHMCDLYTMFGVELVDSYLVRK